ncbi:MAG: VOC family protein [Syntrophothermus sp.]
MLKKVDVIGISTKNLERLAGFYQDILGLKKSNQFPGTVVFYLTGLMITITERSHLTEQCQEPGRISLSFFVDDIQKVYATLKEKGVNFIQPPVSQPWGGKMAIFSDPDGNILHLSSYLSPITRGF